MKTTQELLAKEKISLSEKISTMTDTIESTRTSLIEEKKASIVISEENQVRTVVRLPLSIVFDTRIVRP